MDWKVNGVRRKTGAQIDLQTGDLSHRAYILKIILRKRT